MKKKFSQRQAFISIVILLFGLHLSGDCLSLDPKLSESAPSNVEADFRLLSEALNTIGKEYVNRAALKPKEMVYGAISGLVDSLGDKGHSRFMTPEMVRQEHNVTRGELEGIGAELRAKDGQIVIVSPIDDSPAFKAGIKPGDIILKVNGEDVGPLPLDQVVTRILGPSGTIVKLTILTPSSGITREIEMKRARIVIRSVTWNRLPETKFVHLRIATFSRGVGNDLRKALIEIKQEEIKGLVLDLRNNPGGVLVEAVSVASQFLTDGNVLLTRNAKGEIKAMPVKPGGVAPFLPLVVLINRGTASGAEIVSGAIQDANRGDLIGEKSFGAGTVLQEFPLSDGSALLLAVEEWLTPGGHVIWHRGITPQITVSLPPEVILLVPEREKGMTMADLRTSGDEQLLKAVDLLSGERKQSRKAN